MFKTILLFFISFIPFDYKKVISVHKIPLGFYIYVRNYLVYLRHSSSHKFNLQLKYIRLNLFDRFDSGGNIPRHYFHQDIWMAKKIYYNKTKIHYDIGSRLDGFIAHVLVFAKVIMLDIREINFDIEGLDFIQANAMDMSNIESSSIDSISTLHVIEHFGLGRYGDPIDPDGYIKAIKEIQRIAKNNIYFSVPIGRERLIFDSHRIFDPVYIIELFDQCSLLDFCAIDDNNVLQKNIAPENCKTFEYGCGLYHFKKILR